MPADEHVRRGHPILFSLIVIFGIVELGISGFLTGRYNSRHDYPNRSIRDRARFLLFTSIWTVFFGLFYLVLFIHSSDGSILTSVGSHLAFFALTWVFWTAGAAAITAALGGGHNCSTLKYQLPYCNQLNALEGFAWTEWILFTFGLIVAIALAIRSVRHRGGYSDQLIAH